MKTVIGVMGGHLADKATTDRAYALGAAIAQAGFVLLTGGRNEGVMAAATLGAKEAGGETIGIHPGMPGDVDVADADLVVFTGINYARNMVNILTSHIVVAMPGDVGTLNEVAYAVTFNRPVILFGFDDKQWFGDRVHRAENLHEVLQWIATLAPK